MQNIKEYFFRILKTFFLHFFIVIFLFSNAFSKTNSNIRYTFKKFLKNLKSVKLSFLQINYLPYENNPDSIYQGIFIFKRPNKFFVKYLQDENGNIVRDYLVGNGKYIKIYIAENNQTKIISYKDLVGYFPFSYLFSKNIEKYFKVRYKNDKKLIYLIPKYKSDYSLIIIRLNTNKKFPIKYILIVYPDRRKTYFVIEQILRYNYPIKNNIFKIKINHNYK